MQNPLKSWIRLVGFQFLTFALKKWISNRWIVSFPARALPWGWTSDTTTHLVNYDRLQKPLIVCCPDKKERIKLALANVCLLPKLRTFQVLAEVFCPAQPGICIGRCGITTVSAKSWLGSLTENQWAENSWPSDDIKALWHFLCILPSHLF